MRALWRFPGVVLGSLLISMVLLFSYELNYIQHMNKDVAEGRRQINSIQHFSKSFTYSFTLRYSSSFTQAIYMTLAAVYSKRGDLWGLVYKDTTANQAYLMDSLYTATTHYGAM
jgi:hypothetical protein